MSTPNKVYNDGDGDDNFLLLLIELFFGKCYGRGATGENSSNAVSLIQNISGRMGCPTNHFCINSWANECLSTLSQPVFTQGNFLADFLQVKCDFTPKTAVLHFEPPVGGLGAT